MKRRDGPGDDARESHDVDRRRSRKRKAESTGEVDADKSIAHAIELVKITALSVPNENFIDRNPDDTPFKRKKRTVHQISLEKEKPDEGETVDTPPRYAVSLRDVYLENRYGFEIEEDLQYEKALRKVNFWRKVFPCLREEDSAQVPRKEPKSKVGRLLLTPAIAQYVGMKSSIFIKIRSLILYMIFMMFVTFISFGSFSSETYHFTKVVSSVFCDCVFYCNEKMGTFYTVKTLDEGLCFVENCFKPGISSGLWGKRGVDPEIQLLTTPRFRQVRVASQPCLLSLKNETLCYGSFSENTESKETFTAENTEFVYSESKDRPVSFTGYYGTYSNHGHSFLISSYANNYAYMPNPKWIDKGTSAVFLDFVLYSTNTNLFCAVQFMFEMPASGLIRPSHNPRAVLLMRYHSVYGHFILAMEFVVMFLNCLYTLEALTDLWYFKCGFFTRFAECYNLATTILCWYAGYCLVLRQMHVHDFFTTRFLKSDFFDFHPVLEEHVHCVTILAVLFLFASFKIYHFLSFDLMEHLRITIRTSFKDIIVFVLVFTIILWAFAQVASLLFGQALEKYRSFTSTFSELMKVMLGDLDYKGPMMIHNIIGPMFILSYVIFAVFVLISMFFAIINSTFTIVSNIVDIELESYCGFLKHCWRKIRAKCTRRLGRHAPVPKVEEKKLKNSERIRNLLLDSGYTDVEIKLFFCRYIVDDAQDLDDAVFEKMWNLRIQPQRLHELKQLVDDLGKIVDALLLKADWLAGRIKHIQDTRLGRSNKVTSM